MSAKDAARPIVQLIQHLAKSLAVIGGCAMLREAFVMLETLFSDLPVAQDDVFCCG